LVKSSLEIMSSYGNHLFFDKCNLRPNENDIKFNALNNIFPDIKRILKINIKSNSDKC